MFNEDFYPTQYDVIEQMIRFAGIPTLEGKIILEPQGGSGNIVDYCYDHGAREVIACETDPRLRKILQSKCKIIENDFFNLTADRISHIDYIIMNPPFSKDEHHILHAFEIAPPGCIIVAVCPTYTITRPSNRRKKKLVELLDEHGYYLEFGACFSSAERKTDVPVTGLCLQKPGAKTESEFDGFFMEDDDDQGDGKQGVMQYNAVRDLVNRYVEAVKIFDSQLVLGMKMNGILNNFYGAQLAFTCTQNGVPKLRRDFKKDLQREGWKFIFDKMNLQKYATQGVTSDINKFIEQQENIPFTMKNIYRMLEIVVGTAGQRMDKALVEVFEKITDHHHDNRKNIDGWKTNSHYMVARKFILPGMCYQDQRWYKGQKNIQMLSYGSTFNLVEDLLKALCYITGDKYESLGSLANWIRYPYKTVTDDEVFYHYNYDGISGQVDKKKELYKKGIANRMVHSEPVYGEWFEWAYFRCKAYKKGSMHFEFKDPDVWARFNERVAKIKGYELFEPKKHTKFQDKQTGRPNPKKKKTETKLAA